MDFSNETLNVEIAKLLQNSRQKNNLTLEQLSTLSHVPIVHLASIEEGRFSRFDNFYLKMYLKKYAQAVNVDLNEVMASANAAAAQMTSQPKEERQQVAALPVESEDEVKIITPKTPERTVIKSQRDQNVHTLLGPNYVKQQNPDNGRKWFFVTLTAVVVIVLGYFTVNFFMNYGATPAVVDDNPTVVLPDDINVGGDGHAEEEGDKQTEEKPEEKEETISFVTTVSLEEQVGNIQTFNVATNEEQIKLKITHSGQNWIRSTFNDESLDDLGGNNGRIFDEDVAVTLKLNDNDTLVINMGAIHNVSHIYVNDIPVEFAEGVGPQVIEIYIKQTN